MMILFARPFFRRSSSGGCGGLVCPSQVCEGQVAVGLFVVVVGGGRWLGSFGDGSMSAGANSGKKCTLYTGIASAGGGGGAREAERRCSQLLLPRETCPTSPTATPPPPTCK